jgi:hypothetical protein
VKTRIAHELSCYRSKIDLGSWQIDALASEIVQRGAKFRRHDSVGIVGSARDVGAVMPARACRTQKNPQLVPHMKAGNLRHFKQDFFRRAVGTCERMSETG